MFNHSQEFRSFKDMTVSLNAEFSDKEGKAINILRARYDEFIRYSDKQFEYFIAELTEKGMLQNTIIILSADHGESFEHNYVGHAGPYLYEQLTHIPLIIKEPNQSKKHIINELVDQVDITSTILDLVEMPVPDWMEGRSLAPLMRGRNIKSKPIYSMAFDKNLGIGHKIEKGTIAVWEGDYKLVHDLEKDESLLFNLNNDPDELRNIFDEKPEISQRLLNFVHENIDKANDRIDMSSRK